MVDNYEKAKGESSEWRTPKSLLDAIGLEYIIDPCAPLNGYCAVPAQVRFTVHDDGLRRPWPAGLAFVNSPWSEQRRGIMPWLRRFFAHEGGGICLCVARTSCDWFHELVLPYSEVICLPDGKTRFFKPDGSLGPMPTNGIAVLGMGEVACTALRRSGLGHCLVVDRNATTSARIRALRAAERQPSFDLFTGTDRIAS
jgi:hypothetical protein